VKCGENEEHVPDLITVRLKLCNHIRRVRVRFNLSEMESNQILHIPLVFNIYLNVSMIKLRDNIYNSSINLIVGDIISYQLDF